MYTLTQTESLTPGRTGWEATDPQTGHNLASGFCALASYPQFAHACVQDALARPYDEISKTFNNPPGLMEVGCSR